MHQENVVTHSPPIFLPIRKKIHETIDVFQGKHLFYFFKYFFSGLGIFFIYSHLLTFIVAIYLIHVCELHFGLVFHTHVGYEQKTVALVKTLTSASDNILF